MRPEHDAGALWGPRTYVAGFVVIDAQPEFRASLRQPGSSCRLRPRPREPLHPSIVEGPDSVYFGKIGEQPVFG
jgi:hypothetical protein